MIDFFLYLVTFILGLFVGSFLNVVSDRSVRGEGFLKGRSHCDKCGKSLSTAELVPLLSYVSQKGKCKHCRVKLSKYYPISELLTGISFVGVAYYLDIFAQNGDFYKIILFVYMIVMISFYIVLFLTDVKKKLLPDKIIEPAILFSILFLVINLVLTAGIAYYQLSSSQFGKYLLEAGFLNLQLAGIVKNMFVTFASAFVLAGFFWILTQIKDGEAMGRGDIKLAFLIGIVNGFPGNILAIFLGFLFGAVISILLIIVGRKTMKDTVPFGPFLILGSVVALIWGKQLLNWYFGLF